MIKVLIIEDDLMLAEIHKEFVDKVSGYKVVSVVHNGEEALKLLKSLKIDLIILDVYMPKMDGFTLLETIRKEGIQMDCILVTAAKRSDQVDQAFKLGAIDYLVKPFDFDRLKSSLDEYIKRRQLITSKQVVHQDDIDNLLKRSGESISELELPKGLNKLTLKLIEKFIEKNHGETFKSDEIASELNLSKVSIRKYFEYLQTIDKVNIITEYGTRGRPSYLYKII